jgi:DNA-binding cell septation regulator SpoVG
MLARWRRAQILCAPSVREEIEHRTQRFHLWLPSMRISDAQFTDIARPILPGYFSKPTPNVFAIESAR